MLVTTWTSGLLHVDAFSYYLRATKTKNALIIACMLLHTQDHNYRWSQSCSSSKKLCWCERPAQKYFGPADYFMAILKHFVCYTFTTVIPFYISAFYISVRWLNAYCSLRLFTTFLLLQHAVYLRNVEWSWCFLRCPELMQLVANPDTYYVN